MPPSRRALLLALVMVPFWTNFLVRTIGWQVILAPEGWLSTLLQGVGIDNHADAAQVLFQVVDPDPVAAGQ